MSLHRFRAAQDAPATGFAVALRELQAVRDPVLGERLVAAAAVVRMHLTDARGTEVGNCTP
jgi:hypothetical protein